MVHLCPKGSESAPTRSPQNPSIMGINDFAPSETALLKTESASLTYRYIAPLGPPIVVGDKQPISGISSQSMIGESPILISACIIDLPSGPGNLKISCASKAFL